MTVIVDGAFSNMVDASETGRLVTEALPGRDGKRDGLVMLGDTQRARWGATPLAGGDPWSYVGASHAGIVTLTESLAREGELVPLDGHEPACRIPMTTIGELFTVGPTHDRIGHLVGKDQRGAFTFYPRPDRRFRKDMSLWRTDRTKQVAIRVEPTHYGIEYDPSKVETMRDQAARLFYQKNIDWTSQSLLTAVTVKPVMGGRAWAALITDDPVVRCGFALWANSTLGMALHWTRGQRQQKGRTLTQIGAVGNMPCPDFRDPRLRASAEAVMHDHPELLDLRLDRAKYAFRDPARRTIDEHVSQMLGIESENVLRDLAADWCAEPSVNPTGQ